MQAPIIGGPLSERFGWRSTLWFLVFSGTVQFLLLLFCLPETMRQTRKIMIREPTNGSIHEPTKWQTFKIYVIEPLKLLRLLRYPPVLLSIAYASFAFGALVRLGRRLLIEVLFEHLHYLLIFRCAVQL